ncbi:MAG: hypothetical protein PHN98_09850 [Smithellaceae bacterium]|nr:hypothetical protein [Smithellaceae bacterium]
MASKRKPKVRQTNPSIDFESYFKIGISRDYIMIRDDFPICEIAPGEFARLTREMFAKNDEVLDAKK